MSADTLTRRQFVTRSLVAGGGLVLGGALRGSLDAAAAAGDRVLNAWVRIASDDTVTVMVSQAEMGQGIATTLPAALVEELGADWSRVKLENSPTAPAYRNPRLNWQFTGNSESMSSFFDLMREMGAAARQMLIEAAAERWRVDPSTCVAENGAIIHRPTKRRLSFGAVADAAATRQPPKAPTLKSSRDWRLLGKSLGRADAAEKIDGRAVFGIDVVVPQMVYAAIRHCPVFGGRVARVDADPVRALPGVIDVVTLPDAVVVVAQRYWQARRALDRLTVTFADRPDAAQEMSPQEPTSQTATAQKQAQQQQAQQQQARQQQTRQQQTRQQQTRQQQTLSSESMAAAYRAALEGDDWHLAHEQGTMRATGAAAVVSEDYESQFLAHATMEPMNCTAHVTSDACEIWAPTQGQELTTIVLAKALDLPADRIRINRTYLGGGFGRRLYVDFALQAAIVSKAVQRPVKLIWSREEDVQHDLYRPAVLHRLVAGVDERGQLRAIEHKLVSPSILQFVFPPAVTDRFDPSCCEGLIESRYRIPNTRTDFKLLKVGVPTSVLRTTGYGPNIFALECFIDELAERAGRDALEYRRGLLEGDTRALAVLAMVAEKSGWSQPPAAGRVRGLAFCEAFHTIIAQVVEASVKDGVVAVHRVVTALDCGDVLDPDITTNSIEGGIAWGLSAALKSEITFANGRTVQSNFHDFEVLRLPEMPQTETHFVNSGARPLGGVGEVGPVTVVPALVNAVSKAIGRRVRSVPLSRHGLKSV